ncbi:hypothetical protein [Saccharopolyspora sp. ASAGF58]|uniref:hypothetical protein n=1 Tax=Saccharopolyspora sp. ASAGF58 TaxID=2719023 RepID=UPI0014402D4F|nr:hypothetical protein [Saccharopolyspora sp. ASAGF58]QIZ36136.1 hypothetical protein FDZ84_17450 [Saccharopolyspora sp. ASAGF58]
MTAKKRKRDRFLPMAWRVERVAPDEVYTFRWGRGAGYFTVHRGDIGSSHGNERLVETVHIVRDWVDESDVAAQARSWLNTRAQSQRRPA